MAGVNGASVTDTLSPTIDGKHIEAARRRLEEMRTWKPETLDPPTAKELETVLGHPVRQMVLLGHNWRNRVYRIQLENRAVALAKQGVMASEAMLQYQHGQLQALGTLKIQGLLIPKALGLIREKRVLLMEFARGETIEALVWNRQRNQELREACQLAGQVLAQIEAARTERITSFPVEALAHDLALAPWSLSNGQQKLLARALDRLRGAEVRLGEVYYDYKAANLLFDEGKLSLIDPPDIFRCGVLLWDFACFRSSMRRHLWRLSLRRPSRRRQALIRQSLRSFESCYFSSVGQPLLEPDLFATAVQLLELQRTAVLMTMQQGKLELAKRGDPIAQGKRLGGYLANRLTLPLLEIEKRWLFWQLSRIPA